MSLPHYIPLKERKAWMESCAIPHISKSLFEDIITYITDTLPSLGSDVTPILFSDIDETIIYNKFIGDYHEANGQWQSTNQQWKDWESNMNIYHDAIIYPDAYHFFENLRQLGVKTAFITNSWNYDRVSSIMSIGGIYQGELYDKIYARHCEESCCKTSRFHQAYKDMQQQYGPIALLSSMGDSTGDDASTLGGKFFLFPNSIYRNCPYFEAYQKQQTA